MTIQADAMGTSTQMGKMFNVNVYFEYFSKADDYGSESSSWP